MRVVFLTHYFPPEVGAPQARLYALARDLAARGMAIAVHTGFPHYPDGGIHTLYRNQPWLVERRDGFQIVRSAVYAAPNRGFARRVLDHAAFAFSALATARLTGPADIVLAETPPLLTAAAAGPYAARKGAALVLNVADRWPASAVELGALRNRSAIRIAERLERASYRRAAALTGPTEGICTALESVPEGRGKTTWIRPSVDLRRFAMNAYQARCPLRVVYAGTVGLAQGLETLVRAAVLAGPDIEVVIAGGGAELRLVKELIERESVPNVRLLGVVAHEKVPELYRDAGAGVVLLRDRRIFEAAFPTKLLEVMAAGRPIVLAGRGEGADFVEREGVGVVVPPEDPRALAAALCALADDQDRAAQLGVTGRRCAEREFGREAWTDAWWRLLTDVSAQSDRARASAGQRRVD